jgi:hypothetical protein
MFQSGGDQITALVPFASLIETQGAHLSLYDLACMNGTSTGLLQMNDFFVSHDQVIERRSPDAGSAVKKSGKIPEWVIPELGIARRALREVANRVRNDFSNNPKLELVRKALPALKSRLKALDQLKKDNTVFKAPDEVMFLRDELIRDSVRLLAIVSGGEALKKNSLASALQLEILLIDSIIQMPALLDRKIRSIAQDF